MVAYITSMLLEAQGFRLYTIHDDEIRVEQLEHGWRIRRPRQRSDAFRATPSGARAAFETVAGLADRRRARRRQPDLFDAARQPVDARTTPAIARLFLHAWIDRARTYGDGLAPLLAARPASHALWLCGTRAFADNAWLIDDARRYRACRAVLWDPARPERRLARTASLAQLLDAAKDWRAWLMHDATLPPTRALHATIEMIAQRDVPLSSMFSGSRDVGARAAHAPEVAGDAPFDVISREMLDEPFDVELDRDIRALRFIPLVRPVRSTLHLAVLAQTALAARRGMGRDVTAQLHLVQHADADDLRDVLARVGDVLGLAGRPRMLLHTFGTLVAIDDVIPRHGGLRALVNARLTRYEHVRRARRHGVALDSATSLPSVPLPHHPGLTFLRSIADVVREGERMGHCIATHAPRAVRGEVYLFHVDHDGAQASVEVSRDGRVLDAQGPGNVANAASVEGRAALSRWGLSWSLRGLQDRSDDDAPVCVAGWPPLPAGDDPIRSLGQLRACLASVSAPRATLARFLQEQGAACARGARWLVVRAIGPGRVCLTSVDAGGRIRAQIGLPRRAAGRTGALALRVADGLPTASSMCVS